MNFVTRTKLTEQRSVVRHQIHACAALGNAPCYHYRAVPFYPPYTSRGIYFFMTVRYRARATGTLLYRQVQGDNAYPSA